MIDACYDETPSAVPMPLNETDQMICVLVESPSFSGYLVAAMPQDLQSVSSLMNVVRSNLFQFLRQNGEEIEDAASMSIRVQPVSFLDWAVERADFIRKAHHEGKEIAMAFFPRLDVKLSFEESVDSEMAALKIDELTLDVPLEFNAYLHMPKNDKYVLYTPYGASFNEVQKERLTKQGISHLHILKIDLSEVDRYRAQIYFNSRIAEYFNSSEIQDLQT